MFKNKDFNSSLPYFRKYAVPGPRFDLSCLHPDLIAKMNSNSNTANEDGGEVNRSSALSFSNANFALD